MKAGIVITGSGSILVLTSEDSLDNPEFVKAVGAKGIHKYIAFEVPEETVRNRYGQHFMVTVADRKQHDVLRIVDVDGQRIFRNFDLSSLGGPILYDEHREMRRAA
jgi:hypothetical protein